MFISRIKVLWHRYSYMRVLKSRCFFLTLTTIAIFSMIIIIIIVRFVAISGSSENLNEWVWLRIYHRASRNLADNPTAEFLRKESEIRRRRRRRFEWWPPSSLTHALRLIPRSFFAPRSSLRSFPLLLLLFLSWVLTSLPHSPPLHILERRTIQKILPKILNMYAHILAQSPICLKLWGCNLILIHWEGALTLQSLFSFSTSMLLCRILVYRRILITHTFRAHG